jgi:hypothetical protein
MAYQAKNIKEDPTLIFNRKSIMPKPNATNLAVPKKLTSPDKTKSIDSTLLSPRSHDSQDHGRDLEYAIKYRHEKNDHTDFYVRLHELTDRIHIYKGLFLDKQPKFIHERKNEHRLLLGLSKAEMMEKQLKAQARSKAKKTNFYENLSKNTMSKKHRKTLYESQGSSVRIQDVDEFTNQL